MATEYLPSLSPSRHHKVVLVGRPASTSMSPLVDRGDTARFIVSVALRVRLDSLLEGDQEQEAR